jgi:hypothetical protein
MLRLKKVIESHGLPVQLLLLCCANAVPLPMSKQGIDLLILATSSNLHARAQRQMHSHQLEKKSRFSLLARNVCRLQGSMS